MGAGGSKGRLSRCPVSRSELLGKQTMETADGAGSGPPAPPCSLRPLLGVTGHSRGPRPPHSHLGSLGKHVWAPWPLLAPRVGACQQPCECSRDAGLQVSSQRPPNPCVCSPSTTEGNRPCQACSVSACLKLSWVCTCTCVGLCMGMSVPGCGSGQPPPDNISESRRCEVDAHAPVVRNPGGF